MSAPLTKAITQYTSEAELTNHGLIKPTAVRADLTNPRSFARANVIPAGVHVDPGLLVDFLSLTTDSGQGGVAYVFDIGQESAVAVTKGVFSYNSWETLKSEQNNIFLEGSNKVLTITFTLLSSPTRVEAVYVVVVDELQDFPQAMGRFVWDS